VVGSQLNEISGLRKMVALETAVLNNFINESARPGIFSDVAIETQPYLLSARKNFDYFDYLDEQPSAIGKRIWQNLAISLASTQSFQLLDTLSADALGFGLSTILLNGQPSDTVKAAFKNALELYETRLAHSSRILIAFEVFEVDADNSPEAVIDMIMNEVQGDDFENSPQRVEEWESIRSILNQLDWSMSIEDRQNQFEALYDDSGFNFPTEDFNLSYSARSGCWLNISYRPKSKLHQNGASSSELLVLGRIIWHHDDFYKRFIRYDGQQAPSLNTDLGLKYNIHRPKWTLGVEVIGRIQSRNEFNLRQGVLESTQIKENGLKYMLDFNYAVHEHITLSYNLGKNFDEEFGAQGNLISLIGLSIDFAELSVNDLLKNALAGRNVTAEN